MSMLSALLVSVVIFLLLTPALMLFSAMWVGMKPYVDAATPAAGRTVINNLGNTTYLYLPDTTLTVLYFCLLGAVFLSALYESAGPETIPIGLLFIIPLIFITFPLSDMAHSFITNPGFANVAQYYSSTQYLSDNSPTITILATLGYLVFVTTKRKMFAGYAGMPSSPGIITG